MIPIAYLLLRTLSGARAATSTAKAVAASKALLALRCTRPHRSASSIFRVRAVSKMSRAAADPTTRIKR